MDENTWIKTGFAGLVVGIIIILIGVFLDGVLALVIAGAAIMMISVILVTVPLLAEERHEEEHAEVH